MKIAYTRSINYNNNCKCITRYFLFYFHINTGTAQKYGQYNVARTTYIQVELHIIGSFIQNKLIAVHNNC